MSNPTGRSLPTITQVWLKWFTALLLLFFILFIAFATAIIFTRADRSIASLLDRALTITWEEYNHFAGKSTISLTALATELETGVVTDPSRLAPVLGSTPGVDLWLVAGRDGQVLLASAPGNAQALQSLTSVWQSALQSGKPESSNEILTLEQVRAYSPALAQRAVLDQSDSLDQPYGALFQVAAVPYRNPDHQVAGVLVAAHLVNNDNSIANQLAVEIPDSFSTISIGGIRVAGNISSRTNPNFLGKVQTPAHIKAIQSGQRYYGRVQLSGGLDHLVVSDPIRNAQGQVIGALTIGHPSQGLASLKQDTTIYIILSALLCWGAVLVGSALASKRWADPIMQLSKVANRIYEAEVIRPEHLTLIQRLPPATTSELENLQRCFSHMAGSLHGYFTTLEARVEEKTLELRNAMLDLEASSNAKSKLLSNTSHELRTPLNSIIGFSDMLTSGIYGELTPEQGNRVQIIADSARYLLKLINDLLEVSLVQQGKLALEKQPVNIAELLESVLAIIQNDCARNAITISVASAPALPTVVVDPTRIRQVLYNILSNAVKFTPGGGQISVRLAARGTDVVVAVTDTGIGISEKDQLYVFDEFYQAENTGYRKQAGFGLGLPLSKQLVELHGGHIGLESALGKGTTITITLPGGAG
jgi:signal transduction histidine kinase